MKTPQQLLKATKYSLDVDDTILAIIPRSEAKKVEVFKLEKYMTNKEIVEEYKRRGLRPASLEEILSIEKDYDYIATLWDTDCYLAFHRWGGGRGVYCSRNDDVWFGYWFLSGVPAPRKSLDLGNSALLDTQSLELPTELIINGRKYKAV